MNNLRLVLVCMAAGLSASAAHAISKSELSRLAPVPATEKIPTFDFVRWAQMNSPKLNRAGTHVAALMSVEDGHVQLLAQDLGTQKYEYLIAPDEMDVTSFDWLDDRHILFTVQGNRMFVAPIGDFKHAYRVLEYCSPELIGIPEANRMRPLVWVHFFDDNNPCGLVVAAKAEYGDTRPVSWEANNVNGITYVELNQEHVAAQFPRPPSGVDAGYVADKEGELAFGITYKDGVGSYLVFANGAWKTSSVDTEERRIIGPGHLPGEAVVVARNATGTTSALQFMDVATGTLGKVLLQDAGYDFNGWLFRDPASHEIMGAVYDRALPTVVWFSEAYRNLQKTVDAFFPGLVVRIIDADRAGKKFVLATWSDRQPVAYFILDVEKNAVGPLKNSAPWLDPKRMSSTSVMQFKTRDGQKLDAYVTIPPGASKANPVPLVVLLDTGIWGRATGGFDHRAQFFASRGYAVLRPNHRWSAGYAWMFPREDEWAFDKMGQDVADATKTVLRSGLIDRQRIAVMGTGFAANFALTAVVDSPDLYRCAVAVGGIFDLGQLIKEQKYFQHVDPAYGLLARKLGDPRRDKEKLNAMSPARRADRIHIPVYIAQHREASGAAVAQSRILTSQLDANHTPYEMHWQSGIWYGTQQLDDAVELLDTIDAFCTKNMPTK